jgi:hypothetical protein
VPEALWASGPVDGPIRDVVYTTPGELPRLEWVEGTLPLRTTRCARPPARPGRGGRGHPAVRQRSAGRARGDLHVPAAREQRGGSHAHGPRRARHRGRDPRARSGEAGVHGRGGGAGKTAALLEQERPNMFTQSVANIPPGAAIDVEIRYVQTLTYDAGEYEFVFPTVVGPRYVPGDPLARGASGTGRSGDTDRVPDASRISPPILGRRRSHRPRPGDRGHRRGGLADHGLGRRRPTRCGPGDRRAAARAADATATDPQPRLRAALPQRGGPPGRPHVRRSRGRADAGGHFMLVAEPPRLDVDALVGQRELIFVVDVSGSMAGTPLDARQGGDARGARRSCARSTRSTCSCSAARRGGCSRPRARPPARTSTRPSSSSTASPPAAAPRWAAPSRARSSAPWPRAATATCSS